MAAGTALAGEPGAIRLRDVAAGAGVDFRFFNGSRGKHDLPEIMGGGVGLIDFDGDGRLDLFFANGGPIGGDGEDPPCRLFRNRGGWRFEDVTERAGAPGPGYAMGCAVGDYEADGRDDLFVSGWRDQRLYKNLGSRFEDVTERAGVVSNLWGTSAAFADLDGDGDLDLFVAAYVDYDPARAPFCAAPDGKRDYCGPEDFAAQGGRLYRNNGDGTFSDVSREAGIRKDGRGLGVLIAELTGDGRPDIYVTNDGTACHLYENRGGLRFAEVGEERGVAFDGRGNPLAGMGVGLADLDGDGRSDLVVSNLHGRGTVAFGGLDGGHYRDVSAVVRLTAATRAVTGFGLGMVDLDGDGWVDLFQANGHVLDRERLGVPFAMRPNLLRNEGGRLVDVGKGARFERSALGRGVAVGDLDEDGRPDLVVSAIDGRAAVLGNETEGGRWLGIELIGAGQGIGARLRVQVGGWTVLRDVVGGGSYLSASSRVVSIGLGEAEGADRVEVAWPSGRVEVWEGPLRGRVALREGSGRGR